MPDFSVQWAKGRVQMGTAFRADSRTAHSSKEVKQTGWWPTSVTQKPRAEAVGCPDFKVSLGYRERLYVKIRRTGKSEGLRLIPETHVSQVWECMLVTQRQGGRGPIAHCSISLAYGVKERLSRRMWRVPDDDTLRLSFDFHRPHTGIHEHTFFKN